MRTLVYHDITELDYDLWQQATRDHPFLSREWLVYSHVMTPDDPHYYVIICDGDEAIAATLFIVIDNEQIPVETSLVHGVVTRYLRAHPLVVARTPIGTSHHALCLPDDALLRQQALHAIIAQGKQILRQHDGSFLLFDYLDPPELTYHWDDLLLIDGFMLLGTRLNIGDFATFEDYKQAVRDRNGKRARQDINRHIRRAEEMGITVEFRHHLPPHLTARAQTLFQQLDDKYDHEPAPNEVRFMHDIMQNHAIVEDTFWMLSWLDGRLVACELLIYDRQAGIVVQSYFGRDMAVEYVYFYSYYSVIRYAIETLNARRIIGNVGAEHFKYRIGFVPDTRNNFAVYPASPLARAFANLLLRLYDEPPAES